MEQPKVFILILNWNQKKYTLQCIRSIKKTNYKNYKIVLIDNNSDDNTTDAVKLNFPDVKIIQNKKNYGYAEGNNKGIKYALKNKADYVLILNNDTIISKDSLKKLIQVIQSDKKIGVAGPKVYSFHHRNYLQSTGLQLNLITGSAKDLRKNFRNPREVDAVIGCGLLVRAEIFRIVGLLDKKFFMYMEEIDFCIRVKKKGYKIIYVPSAKIWHKGGASSVGVNNKIQIYYDARNIILLMRKNVSTIKFLLFLFMNIFYFTPRKILSFIKNRKSSNILVYLKGKINGLFKI